MKPYTADQIKRHLDRGADHCPECGEFGAGYDNIEFESGAVWQEGACPACGATWRHVYTLTDVVRLADGGEVDDEIWAWTDGEFWWHEGCVDPGESDVELRAVFGPEEVEEGARCDTCDRPANGDDPGEGLEALFALARRHGERDDPDHEVGDLQDLCRALWDLLTPG